MSFFRLCLICTNLHSIDAFPHCIAPTAKDAWGLTIVRALDRAIRVIVIAIATISMLASMMATSCVPVASKMLHILAVVWAFQLAPNDTPVIVAIDASIAAIMPVRPV